MSNVDEALNPEDETPAPYTVILSPAAVIEYKDIPTVRDFNKVRKLVELLDILPEIGHIYDPDYPAARTPFEMRVAYAGRYGIYYVIDEPSHEVRVLFIEDQRRDPLNRFYGLYPHETE